jgi:hypothetical protein
MPRAQLRQAQVDQLSPRRTQYIVRDSEVRGFGVRVSPSGRKRYVLQAQHEGTRIWRDCGDARSVSLVDARELAITELRQLQQPDSDPSSRYPALAFETVAEEVLRRYGCRWKPRTLYANRCYYRRQILPWFQGRPITSITAKDVQAWFASLRATLVAADRSAPVLSVIFREAEAYGYRPEDSNPCKSIRRYRRRGRERSLSPAELHCLGGCAEGRLDEVRVGVSSPLLARKI